MLINYTSRHRHPQTRAMVTTGKQRLECNLCHRHSLRIVGGETTPAGWADLGGDVHHCPECVADFPEALPADMGAWPDARVSRAQAARESFLRRLPGHSKECRGIGPVGQACCAFDAARRGRLQEIAALDGERRRRLPAPPEEVTRGQ